MLHPTGSRSKAARCPPVALSVPCWTAVCLKRNAAGFVQFRGGCSLKPVRFPPAARVLRHFRMLSGSASSISRYNDFLGTVATEHLSLLMRLRPTRTCSSTTDQCRDGGALPTPGGPAAAAPGLLGPAAAAALPGFAPAPAPGLAPAAPAPCVAFPCVTKASSNPTSRSTARGGGPASAGLTAGVCPPAGALAVAGGGLVGGGRSAPRGWVRVSHRNSSLSRREPVLRDSQRGSLDWLG